MICPKCGGDEFEIVTIDSVLQRVSATEDSQPRWDTPITLAVLRIAELRCTRCGVDYSHDETMKRLLAERLA